MPRSALLWFPSAADAAGLRLQRSYPLWSHLNFADDRLFRSLSAVAAGPAAGAVGVLNDPYRRRGSSTWGRWATAQVSCQTIAEAAVEDDVDDEVDGCVDRQHGVRYLAYRLDQTISVDWTPDRTASRTFQAPVYPSRTALSWTNTFEIARTVSETTGTNLQSDQIRPSGSRVPPWPDGKCGLDTRQDNF